MKKMVLILFILTTHLLATNKINHIEVNYHDEDSDNYEMNISGKFIANDGRVDSELATVSITIADGIGELMML